MVVQAGSRSRSSVVQESYSNVTSARKPVACGASRTRALRTLAKFSGRGFVS